MNKPLISVVMPVYNCENTVALAIKSILDQTYPNIELIVVDDKSTDGTRKVVESLVLQDSRVRLADGEDDPHRFDEKLKRNVNAGYSARNTGLKIARGEYITFQDADDVSLLNRIEIQYDLLIKYGATSMTIDWIKFDERHVGKRLEASSYLKNLKKLGPEEIYEMSQRSKGLIAKISRGLNSIIPFHIKRKALINKFFFGSLENYPGAGNSPLFKREVLEKVMFRKLSERVWPSFMGRGADKDFNFQVAETFKGSWICFVPLYMWRQPSENPEYKDGIDGRLI